MYDIIILSGISGAGKTYLINQAIKKYEWLCQVPSITTREKREGIDESEARVFLSDILFDCELKSGNLVFVNTVFEKKYAYRYSDILNSIEHGKTVLLDMKIDTVHQVRRLFPNTLCLYIKVNSMNIESEIGLGRNNLELRLADAINEQKIVDNVNAIGKEVDILFINNMDDDSLFKFMDLLIELKGL